MIIYGDILFILNMVIDYLLISLTSVIVGINVRFWRQILSAFLGGISSFYIFIDDTNLFIDISFRIVVTFLMMIIAFGIKSIRRTLKAGGLYFVCSLILGSLVNLIANTFKVQSVMANNTFFYIGISPLMLIILSVAFYFISVIIYRYTKNSPKGICKVIIQIDNKNEEFYGLVDSGNSITDIMTNSEVFITNNKVLRKLTGLDNAEELLTGEYKNRCRLIPTDTVNGKSILYALRCEGAKIMTETKEYAFSSPIIAFSPHLKSGDYDIIIPQKTLEGEKYEIFR